MYDENAQFDAMWAPKRYPTTDYADATAVWRRVVDAVSGEVGVVWLSDNSAGVKWITQTDSINVLRRSFDQSASLDLSMSNAYLSAVREDGNFTLADEESGEMADVVAYVQTLMDNVTSTPIVE